MTDYKTISSLQHPLVKHWVHLRLNRDYRHEHSKVLIEGKRMISELSAQKKLDTFICTIPDYFNDVDAKEYYLINEAILEKITGVQAPEGFLAEITMASSSNLAGKKKVLVLDNINDPGNLGTMLRTALALGWEGVFILGNCADPYNDKALRAAKGATFKLPLAFGAIEDLKKLAENEAYQIFVANIQGNSPEKLQVPNNMLLVMSNETHGVSPEVATLGQSIAIPMQGNMESLNVSVASGILMYALNKDMK